MQNLWKILLRYSNFLVFILLEVAAFLLVVYNSAAPRSSLLSTANQIVAWQYEQCSEVEGYFRLRSLNEQLAAENASLRSQLAIAKQQPEIQFQPAKVVQMTTDRQHNYLTINRGEKDGVQKGQGVRSEDGVVGIVYTVGKRYSVVIPIIHTQMNLSCRFLKNDYIGTLQWDGKDYRVAQLTDVATHINVREGDTIVTSGLSPVFPEGIPVGIVENCTLKEGASYYTIQVRLQVDFKRLRYVEIVQNGHQQEMEELTNGLD